MKKIILSLIFFIIFCNISYASFLDKIFGIEWKKDIRTTKDNIVKLNGKFQAFSNNKMLSDIQLGVNGNKHNVNELKNSILNVNKRLNLNLKAFNGMTNKVNELVGVKLNVSNKIKAFSDIEVKLNNQISALANNMVNFQSQIKALSDNNIQMNASMDAFIGVNNSVRQTVGGNNTNNANVVMVTIISILGTLLLSFIGGFFTILKMYLKNNYQLRSAMISKEFYCNQLVKRTEDKEFKELLQLKDEIKNKKIRKK